MTSQIQAPIADPGPTFADSSSAAHALNKGLLLLCSQARSERPYGA